MMPQAIGASFTHIEHRLVVGGVFDEFHPAMYEPPGVCNALFPYDVRKVVKLDIQGWGKIAVGDQLVALIGKEGFK